MADYTSDELLAFLNRAWNNAGADANSLPDQLVAEQQAAIAFIAPVGSVSHLSKNSTSLGYGGYNPGNLTIRQIVNIWTDLIRRYARVKDAIISAAACAVPPVDLTGFDFDDSVFCQMKNQLAIECQADTVPDISTIRFGYCQRPVNPEFACA